MIQLKKIKKLYRSSRCIRFLMYPAMIVYKYIENYKIRIKQEVIENLKKIVINEPIINVPNFYGKFQINIKSDLFSRTIIDGNYEKDLTEAIAQYINIEKDAIDVGANIGFYSILLANKIGKAQRVLSIEPSESIVKRLRHNIHLNNLSDKVIVYEGGAADNAGMKQLNLIEGREEYSSMGRLCHPSTHGSHVKSCQVATNSIDALVNDNNLRVGFMKIDVEGYEYQVIEGSKNTLKEHRPIILSELCDPLLRENGSSSKEVIAKIRSYGYTIIDPLHHGRLPGSVDYCDILCIPIS